MSISFAGAKRYKKHNGFRTFSELKKPLPSPVYFYSLRQGGNIVLKPIVKIGDYVLKGQKIADLETFSAIPVYSSVSGTVISVTDNSAAVENDMLFNVSPTMDFGEAASLTTRELLWVIREGGICEAVTGEPVHELLSPERPAAAVVVRCFDSDPYVSSQQAASLNNAEKILGALDIVRRILSVKKAVIGVEKGTGSIYGDFKYLLRYNNDISLYSLKPRYPQSRADILVKTLTGKGPVDINAVVLSAETLCNIYDVFEKKRPVTEKIITVSGDDILPPDNYLVSTGAPVSSLLSSAGYTKPEMVINGGITDGTVITDLDTPVTNHTCAVIAFNDKGNIPSYRKI